MIETAQNILETLAAERSDFRIHLFDVHPFFEIEASGRSGCLALRGRVLEQSDLDSLLAAFDRALPGQCVDTSGLTILRRPGNPLMRVGTNLTSLHREPSFLAEQLSQMLNGAAAEILIQEDRWCYIRQPDGYLGWTYLPYLTDRPLPHPTHLLIAPVEPLLAQPQPESAVVSRVLGGTALHARRHSHGWLEVELSGGLSGWLPETCLRSLAHLPVSNEQRRAQLVQDAARLTGVPYLWGGTSANGIDCSGLAQLAHRWIGLTIPRDADMQCAAARPVEPPFRPGDLLFFGEHGEKRSITHVAISLGGWQILHSSRSRNGVYCDDVQAVPHLRDSFLQAATFLDD